MVLPPPPQTQPNGQLAQELNNVINVINSAATSATGGASAGMPGDGGGKEQEAEIQGGATQMAGAIKAAPEKTFCN